jgi:hypothetical protein
MRPRTSLAAAAVAFSLFMVGQPAAPHSAAGIRSAAAKTGHAIERSAEAASHYSEIGGKFLVRLLKNARPAPLLPPGSPWR